MWKNQLKYVEVKKGQDRRFGSVIGLIGPDFLQAPRQEWFLQLHRYRLFTKTMHCYNINVQYNNNTIKYNICNIQNIYKYTVMKAKDTYKRENIYNK
jgi:hypothetical protein